MFEARLYIEQVLCAKLARFLVGSYVKLLRRRMRIAA